MADTNSEKAGIWSRAKAAAKSLLVDVEAGISVNENDYGFGADYVGVDVLLGSGKRSNRSRTEIYRKFHYMMGDAIISSALRLHVTMALGGHETTGDTVFIDRAPNIKDGDQRAKIVEELQRVVAPILNANAHTLCFNACGFGDSYARVYTKEKFGLQDINIDEMVYPPMVQPYQRANTTVGFTVSTGRKFNEKLTIKQIARMKMPRMLYLPQTRALEKAQRQAVTEDDILKVPILPSLVGGSFLEAAEEAYDNLLASLTGLVGTRIMGSIDETLVGVNMDGMTKEQRDGFMKSLKTMLATMKARAEKHVKDGTFSTQRNIHILPTNGEKQLTQVSSFQGASAASSITIDDIMLHARLLAGALGIDLSMLGFADQLTGGLGEGGFNQTSAQAAERSGIIRTALNDVCNDIIDLHTLSKYGWVFEDGDRPYAISFYGSIAALESKKQASRERSMNGTAMMLQSMQTMRDLGLPEDVNREIFQTGMELDEDYSTKLAKGIKDAKPPVDPNAGNFGGGNEFEPDSDTFPVAGGDKKDEQ